MREEGLIDEPPLRPAALGVVVQSSQRHHTCQSSGGWVGGLMLPPPARESSIMSGMCASVRDLCMCLGVLVTIERDGVYQAAASSKSLSLSFTYVLLCYYIQPNIMSLLPVVSLSCTGA